MFKANLSLGIIFIVMLTFCIFGCGSNDNPTLAKVGDYVISVEEFNNFFNSAAPFQTADDEFEKRRETLDSIINTRMFIQGAYEKGIDKVEELARVVLANKDKLLLDVLSQRIIVDNSEPTESQMKEFWNKLEYKNRTSHILVDNIDTAQMVLKKIEDGENFEKLAHDYSIDPSAGKNKGDLGYFTWGDMVDEYQNAVLSMEPGQVSPPVKTRFGYHIIKLVDRLPNEYRTDFEQMKPSLKERLTNIIRRNKGEAYFNDIKERYPIRIDTASCDYIIHKREISYPPMLLESLPKNDFDLEQLDRSEKELILGTWNGGQITIMEYLEMCKNLSPTIKPDFDDYDSLAVVIFNLKITDILVSEAHNMGLDNDPDYIKKVKLLKELAMADIMKSDSIVSLSEPDEGMIRQYYDDNPNEFTTPAKVHIYEILLSDELNAAKLAKEIKSRQKFLELAMDLTERPGKRASKGEISDVQEKYFPELYQAALNTPIGAIGGPVLTNGKYSIFYVEDKIEAVLKDFLGVKRTIIDKINRQDKVNAINTWINERKKSTNIEIDTAAIWTTIDKSKYDKVESGSNN